MIILIAESKTMTACDKPVSYEEFMDNKPVCDSGADDMMQAVRDMDMDALRAATRLSAPMAARLRKMALEFPDKSRGSRAIEAYTGVVFKALGYDTLTAESAKRADRDVRIISSLYGWLRPGDIIRPYRLEYTSRLVSDGITMAEYLRDPVTAALLDDLKSAGENEVLDLLPADAAKCIDMAGIRQSARVCKVDFVSVADGGALRTPHAGLLKKMRGTLLRAMLEAGIRRIEELETFEAPGLLPLGSADSPGHVTFAV